jgi:starch synthase
VPLILASNYRRWRMFDKARSIFVIHNMGYHGVYPNPPNWESPRFSFRDFGLSDDAYYDRYVWTFPVDERPSKGRDPRDTGEAIKLLRGGIEMADRVVTVAPSYKDEIMSLEGGFGMHDTPRGRSYHLDGILNGIDINEWNPSNDSHIAAPYSVDNLKGKKECKRALQEQLGLEKKPDTPIVAFIGRLAPQKGVDLLEESLGWLMGGDHMGVTGDVQLIMMGSGEGRYAEFLMRAEAQHKGRVVGYVGFSPEMEHKIIAGADILIMPSKYEPCGLPQMYAQRYGTVPVVHATGGLKDSVVAYNPFANATNGQDGGTGWQFDAPDAGGIRFGLWNALHTYKHFPESWVELMKRCMRKDFSWDLSAKKYEQVFHWALGDAPFVNPWPFQG